jgi:L-ascorbate metabolism protein UlaG (beta-lactamase superfamily)
MKLRLIRHATLQIELAGQQVLVDPLFADPATYPSLTLGASSKRNPTVPLPCPLEPLLKPDILLVTHAHFDHFDRVARRLLPKQIPLLCQPVDSVRFRRAGFTHLLPVGSAPVMLNGLKFSRTSGRHGHALLGRLMGPVSGFLIKAENEPLLFIAGDTVWTPMLQAFLEQVPPDIIVLNTGAAQFNLGAPITMSAADVAKVCHFAPQAKVIAVHLEAINHCRLSRPVLAQQLLDAGLASQVIIPADGESLDW